jgi:hypothetical protein
VEDVLREHREIGELARRERALAALFRAPRRPSPAPSVPSASGMPSSSSERRGSSSENTAGVKRCANTGVSARCVAFCTMTTPRS